MSNTHKQNWIKFRDDTLQEVKPILDQLGFVLDDKQVHIGGERYLSSGKKLVLLGHGNNKQKVIIKLSKNQNEIKEIKAERERRKVLNEIIFAYRAFVSPKEILFTAIRDYQILITEYIGQNKTFLERGLKKQFFYSLRAFSAQEGVHATTKGHLDIIKKHFGIISSQKYLDLYNDYIQKSSSRSKPIMETGKNILKNNLDILTLYSNFLTHWDFVPHNIRINNDNIYLLDHSSFRLGNKHESWARFINFMVLYNRPLEKMLLKYIKKNRPKEESVSLKLMRIFRLGDIIHYYSKSLQNADENLRQLNSARIDFWTNVLENVINDNEVPDKIILDYQALRNSLRSRSELERQKKLH